MIIKILIHNIIKYVKPKINHMTYKELHALTPRKFIIDFNRMMLVLSALPVRFDSKLKIILRTQL